MLQAVASIADDPTGRAQLAHTVPQLADLEVNPAASPFVRKHAHLALRALGWVAAGITMQ